MTARSAAEECRGDVVDAGDRVWAPLPMPTPMPLLLPLLLLFCGLLLLHCCSREILLWRAAYLASLGACLCVMRAQGPGISCGAFLAAKEQSTRPWLAVVWLGSRAKDACPH